jgi:hypothetical protein
LNQEKYIERLLSETTDINLPKIQSSLDLILKGSAEMLQLIQEAKPELEEGEVYIETLVSKIIFSSKSVLDLSYGTEFTTLRKSIKFEIIDIPSIYVLIRSVIEAFLTLEYLFINDLSPEERSFRFDLWRVSGIMSRQNYKEVIPIEYVEKHEKEKQLIKLLKVKIKESKYYPTLQKQQIWKLDKFGLPRLISWIELLKASRLKSEFYIGLYKLYSNYAHSEYLSMIQLNEGTLNKNANDNISINEGSLNNLRMINCMTVLLLKEKFKDSTSAYQKLNEDLRFTIEFWEKVSREKK